MAIAPNPNPGFIPESWSLYGVGITIIVLRLFARVRRLGLKGLQSDDYFVAFGAFWYTMLVVAFNRMLEIGGSNLMTDEDIAALTPQIAADREVGSKWVFVSEHAMLLTIWPMKAAMLCLYARITSGSNVIQRRLLKGVAAWVVLAFIGDEIALFTICRPLSQYWAVPVDNPQCASYQYYQIVNAVFNISTDTMILAIGIPPVMKARLTVQQKVVLGIIFGMGTFVIVAAILRLVYCVVPALVSYVYMNWYFREASVAVYVTNLPPLWALLREFFPSIKIIGYSNRKATTSKNTGQPSNPTWVSLGGTNVRSQNKDFDFDLDTVPISKTMVSTTDHEMSDRDLARAESVPGDSSSTSSSRYINKHEIRRDVTFTVEHVPNDEHQPRDAARRDY